MIALARRGLAVLTLLVGVMALGLALARRSARARARGVDGLSGGGRSKTRARHIAGPWYHLYAVF